MTDTFNRYELIERIGAGGMAEVFRAKMIGPAGFQKVVALKRILEDLSSDRDFVHRFVDEARLTARLQHPNICQVLDFGVLDGRYFLTLEYVHGLDLAQLLKRLEAKEERLPPELALVICAGVLRGLQAAHDAVDESGQSLGLVHRDVSPQNVLLSVNGDIKLSDFGAAKANAAVRAARTKDNIALGKIAYMAPEQRMGRPVDARTDLFTTGVLLAEMLLGPRAFRRAAGLSGADKETLAAAAQDRFPSSAAGRVREIIRRAADQKPERRYADAAAMLAEVESVMIELSVPGSTGALSELVKRFLEDDERETRRRDPEPADLDGLSPFSEPVPVGQGELPPQQERPAREETGASDLLDLNDLGLATAPTELAEKVTPPARPPSTEDLETRLLRRAPPPAPKAEPAPTSPVEPDFDQLQTQVVSSAASPDQGAVDMEELATSIHRGAAPANLAEPAAPARYEQPAAMAPPPPPSAPSVEEPAPAPVGPAPPRAAMPVGPAPAASTPAAASPPRPEGEPAADAAPPWMTAPEDEREGEPGLDEGATAPDAPPALEPPGSVEDAGPAAEVALANASRKQVAERSAGTAGTVARPPHSRRALLFRLILIGGAVLVVLAVAGYILAARWRAEQERSPFPLESSDDRAALIGSAPVAAAPDADTPDAAPAGAAPRPDASSGVGERAAPSGRPRRPRHRGSERPGRARPSPSRSAPTPAPAKRPSPRGQASLTIVATPPGRAYVDGRLVGARTPVRAVRVSAGAHQVRVVFSSTGESQTRRVSLSGGEHQVVRFTSR